MTDTHYIPQRRKGFWRRFWLILGPILVVVGFIALLVLTISLNKKPEEKKRSFNTLAVMADYAVSDSMQLVVNTQGEARPQTEIDLVPEVGGKIVYVSPNFIEGGIIRKGETLLRIEDADFKVALIRAKASVAQAEQALVREEAEGAIAKKDYEELGRGEASPLALRLPQQAQARASLQAAQAEVEAAKLQLTRTKVRAPFTGRVRTKSSDLGQFVSPGRTLGRIFSTNIIEVRLPLTDTDMSKLDIPVAFFAKDRASAPDVTLSATIAGQKRVWSGKIMRTDSTYDTQTRALFAFAEVFDPYGKGADEGGYPLAPGLFVDAEISGKMFDNVIVLPRDGLRPQNKVYVVDEKGEVEVRNAEVLDTNAEHAIVTGGVAAGDLIILSPMEDSQLSVPKKVYDINEPTKILVDPPKPDWMKAQEAAEANGGKKKKRKKGAKDEEPQPLKKKDQKPESRKDKGSSSGASSSDGESD